MRIPILVATVFFCFYVSAADAGSDGYVCTVESFNRLTNEGTLVGNAKDPIIGQEFTVDRKSGKIIGKYIGSAGFNTEVLDSGSGNQSFKVLARNPWGFLHVLYLEIQEFHKEPRKPFLLVDASIVYTGTCQ